MSIILMGRSCAGKDTVLSQLVAMGYHRIVTYTTRPMRSGETQGVEYNFVSNEQFEEMIKNNKFAEYRIYKTAEGIWYYGTLETDFYNNRDDKAIIILTPDGYKNLRSKYNLINKYVSIYLYVDNYIIRKRMKQRNSNTFFENIRRYIADIIDFKDVKKIADFTVDNYNSSSYETALKCKYLDKFGRD